MRIYKIRRKHMCDTVRCKNQAEFGIDLNIYLGELHLCSSCLEKTACLLSKKSEEGNDAKVKTKK